MSIIIDAMETLLFKIITLGCRTNQYESQAYREQLIALGYLEAEDNQIADVCIINTCAVTESAEKSSRKQIQQLIQQNPKAKIFVTGCAADKLSDDNVHIIKNSEKEKLVESLSPCKPLPFRIHEFSGHTRAFVKVQDGCNSFCSYCIIPYVRGRSRSRSLEDIISEVSDLVASGYQEIVLTGINLGDYDGGIGNLVRVVDDVKGLKRLRLSSIDPNDVDDDLADAIINGKNTCSSMHLVLQSGSDSILKSMNRKYDTKMFLDVVEKFRSSDSDFTFTTDIIVGFPGETEDDFVSTLELMDKVRFAKVHMFPYSLRAGTLAAKFPDQVPFGLVQERRNEILRISEEHAYGLREQYVSRKMTVLTENLDPRKPEHIPAHTDNFLKVLVCNCFKPNKMVDVDLVGNSKDGLIGYAN